MIIASFFPIVSYKVVRYDYGEGRSVREISIPGLMVTGPSILLLLIALIYLGKNKVLVAVVLSLIANILLPIALFSFIVLFDSFPEFFQFRLEIGTFIIIVAWLINLSLNISLFKFMDIKPKTKVSSVYSRPASTTYSRPVYNQFGKKDSGYLTPNQAVLFNQGVYDMQNGNPYKAIDCWEKIARANPRYHDVWNNLGAAYAQIKNFSKARQAFRKLVDLAPNAENWETLGMIMTMEAAERAGPNADPAVLIQAAEEALECFRKALNLNPSNVKLLMKIGMGYAAVGKLDEAVEYLSRYLAKVPNDSNARKALEIVKQKMRGMKPQITACDSCGALMDNDQIFCNTCGAAKGKATRKGGKKICFNCGSVFPGDSIFCTNCGNKLDDVTEVGVSETQIEELLQETMKKEGLKYEKTAKLWMDSAMLAHKGKFREAIDLLKEASEIEPENVNLLSLLSRSYFETGNSSEGKKYAKKALNIDPKDTRTLEILVDYYTNKGEPEKVEKYYNRIKTLGPEYVKELIRQGHVILGSDVVSAVTIWKKAQRLDPNNIEIEVRIKAFESEYVMEQELAQKFRGDLQAAMAYYTKRSRENPKDKNAKRMAAKIMIKQMGGAPAFRYD